MTPQTRIYELLALWEKHRSEGNPVSAEELCCSEPELLNELQAKIDALNSVDRMLFTGTADSHQTKSPDLPAEGTVTTNTHYKLQSRHAHGGLGEVLIAVDETLKRQIALKRMRTGSNLDPQRRSRFLREAEITAQLEHPGIVAVHCMGEDSTNGPFYSMRFIEGQTLEQAIDSFRQCGQGEKDGQRTRRQLLGRFVSVCNTVAYAHRQGYIHRDLKPANIMVGEFGETLVVDWGLAKRNDDVSPALATTALHVGSVQLSDGLNSDDRLTIEGAAIGTPAFMSPEQAAGNSRLTIQSDIYSLGATLYVLLAGVAPPGMQNRKAYLDRIQNGRFPLPRELVSEVPAALNAICAKAMAFKSSDRYKTALELAEDIENWLADEPVSVWRDSFATRSRRWIKRHQTLAATTAVATLGCLAAVAAISLVMSAANEKLRRSNESEQAARTLADQQSDLAMRSLQTVTFDIQRKLKNVPAAQAVRTRLLETAMQGLNEVAEGLSRRSKINSSLMMAHRDLGNVYFEVGNVGSQQGIESARKQYQRALELSEAVMKSSPGDLEAAIEHVICLQRLGKVEVAVGDSDSAGDYYMLARAELERLSRSDSANVKLQRNLLVTHNLIGDLELQQEKIESATQHYKLALEIGQKLSIAGFIDEESDRDLVGCMNKVGEMALRTGDTQAAKLHFQQAFDTNQRRVERTPEDFEALRDMSISHFKLGKLLTTLGDKPAAKSHLLESLALDERRLLVDPTNALAMRDVVESNLSAANILRSESNRNEAEKYLRRGIEIGERLCSADPQDLRTLRTLAFSYGDLGDIVRVSDPEMANQHYQECLDCMRRRGIQSPADGRVQSDIAFGLNKLGDGLLNANRIDEALAHFQSALELHRKRSLENPTDISTQRNLAAYLQRVAIVNRENKRVEIAAQHYGEAVGIAERLALQSPDNMLVQVLLITLLDGQGVTEQARQNNAIARACFDRALEIVRRHEAAGKLTGEDAGWVEYIEDHIKKLEADEPNSDR